MPQEKLQEAKLRIERENVDNREMNLMGRVMQAFIIQ